MKRTERIRAMCESRMEQDRRIIAKWVLKLNVNPAAAFEWSREAMRCAANLEVLKDIQNQIEGGAEYSDVLDSLQGRVLYGARFPSESTSMTANYMVNLKLICCAEFLHTIQGMSEDPENKD